MIGHRKMRFLLNLSLSTLLLSISLTASAADKLQIKNAWIPEAPPVSRVLAGFATFNNPTDKDIEIVSISSTGFGRIEMHLSKEVDGMARMIPQKSLVVQAKKQLTLKHGSYHLMLFKPAKRYLAGTTLNFTMTLSNGQTQNFTAEVRSSMGQSNNHEHHHHH